MNLKRETKLQHNFGKIHIYNFGDKSVDINDVISFLKKARKNGATVVNLTGSNCDNNGTYIHLCPAIEFVEPMDDYISRLRSARGKYKAEAEERIKSIELREKYGLWH